METTAIGVSGDLLNYATLPAFKTDYNIEILMTLAPKSVAYINVPNSK